MKYQLTKALILALMAATHGVLALEAELPNFSDTSALSLNGNATTVTTADGVVLRLTAATMGQSGNAFSLVKVSTAQFSTFFKFRMTEASGINGINGADGITFIIQPVSSTAGGSGGGMGYYGIPNSVGVEFDTYNNGSGSNDSDENHIGININGEFNGPVQSVATPFQDGDLWHVWIDYDGTQMEVRANTTGIRPAAPLLTRTLNISQILGGIPQAYIGFGAGTGWGYENHDIISWKYKDSYAPLLAKGVKLTATKNGNQVDLKLTTTSELDTAELIILRSETLNNGETVIREVCRFDSGYFQYTCTDNVVGSRYQVREIEYDGDIIEDENNEVTPE